MSPDGTTSYGYDALGRLVSVAPPGGPTVTYQYDAVGNRVSAGLPSEFVLISAALLPQTFLNVPFTTALLTHGTGLLFLLWYIMPRTMFDPKIEPAAS